MITILTEPSFNTSYASLKSIKTFIKSKIFNISLPKYAGHYAVVRSLLNGLDKNKQAYNYNPTKTSKIASHVHVLAGVNTLKAAIQLKQQGKISRLTAGPNIVISSADENGIIGSKEIDRYLVNSDWTISAYLLDNPKLINKIDKWAAGIDAKKWDIKKIESNKSVAVFYNKRPEHHLYEYCKRKAIEQGFEVVEIICGSFTHQELKNALQEASVVVYFVEQESQGIALQEIWATNTPTLVWNPEVWMYKNVNYACTSAPYLTDKTGAFFKTNKDFDLLIQKPLSSNFEPRKWVLENMTDEICAKNFIAKATI
ncbi:MAG: hypothetical protein JKX68_01350 [Flavobacteriales bacterium]|nr:hypothetical protein [Flavobacteriales bacterium]